jgi:hypothetical protein
MTSAPATPTSSPKAIIGIATGEVEDKRKELTPAKAFAQKADKRAAGLEPKSWHPPGGEIAKRQAS